MDKVSLGQSCKACNFAIRRADSQRHCAYAYFCRCRLREDGTVKRCYRIQENERFQEIRQQGKSYSSELLVICVLPNALPYSRFGFTINVRLGGAVVRNRLKRRLREAIRLRLTMIKAGWDVVVIARRPVLCVDYHQMDAACARLLRRAHLLREETR